MLIHNASQLITLAGGPQRGSALGRLGVITDGAVVVRGNTIEAVGASADLLRQFPQEERWDAAGSAALPALVDPHTHLVFAGDRAAEAEMRFQGKSYAQIQAAGGGSSPPHAPRAQPVWRNWLPSSSACAKCSAMVLALQKLKPVTVWSWKRTAHAEPSCGWTMKVRCSSLLFMPAHAFPPEFTGREEAYVEEICQHMLPAAKDWWLKHASGRSCRLWMCFAKRVIIRWRRPAAF